MRFQTGGLTAAAILLTSTALAQTDSMRLGEAEYFEKPGANVLVFSNYYDSLFSDSKISGVEIIHHDVRTVTNGDVRLSPTPQQWDPIGLMTDRRVNAETGEVVATLRYDEFDFEYRIRAVARGEGVKVSVELDEPVPAELAGRAGFNLELLPSAYWDKTYFVDGAPKPFPRYPAGDMEDPVNGRAEQTAMATGKAFTLAPADTERRVEVSTNRGEISLYDGRNQAQNGWYVLRQLLPEGETGTVLSWQITPDTLEEWTREPVISYSQVGYVPGRPKVAIVETDPAAGLEERAQVVKVAPSGEESVVYTGAVEPYGRYLRYEYGEFDFSRVTEPGVYRLRYGDKTTAPFRIAQEVYAEAWQPTLDIYFPVQMDHMFVNEGYRVWHGASHLDDALQAPAGHEHFDLYAQGPTNDTKFDDLEHIPGLNVGGWYDAGDYDIRTQSQYGTVRMLVAAAEEFGIDRDQTMIDWPNRHVEMHMPDGDNDLLQQIKHGTIQLVAQFDAVGHAIHGIVEPDLGQYTHLGDGVTKTDNLVYNARLDENEVNQRRGQSGKKDDRWAFTTRSSALQYGSTAALAAASRVLGDLDPELAAKARKIAIETFADEQGKEPDLYRYGNTTGGPLEVERFLAAAELLLTTEEAQYADAAMKFFPDVTGDHFGRVAQAAVSIRGMMPEGYDAALRQAAQAYLENSAEARAENPFGVPITRGGWAGAGTVIGDTNNLYALHTAYPDLVPAEAIYPGVDFIFGRHPGHNLSLVSGVGTESKEVAYGVNRADFSFIAGGVVPGVLILKPDFPENKEDWPFLWGENEYVIPMGAIYLYLAHAADRLATDE